MKALATNVGFKWVLPSELEAAVAGNKGKPVGKKSTKERNVPGVPPPVEVDPTNFVCSRALSGQGLLSFRNCVRNKLAPSVVGWS